MAFVGNLGVMAHQVAEARDDKDSAGPLRMFRQTMKEVNEEEDRFKARKQAKEDTFQHLHDLATGKKTVQPNDPKQKPGSDGVAPPKIQPLMSVKTDKGSDSQDDDEDIEYVTEEIDLHSFGLPMSFGKDKEDGNEGEQRSNSRGGGDRRGGQQPPRGGPQPPHGGPSPHMGGPAPPPQHMGGPGAPPPPPFMNHGPGLLGQPPNMGGPPLPPGPPPPHAPAPPPGQHPGDMMEMQPPPLPPDGVRASNLVVPQVVQLPPGSQIPQSLAGGQILLNRAMLPPNHPLAAHNLRGPGGQPIRLPPLPPGMIPMGPRGIPVSGVSSHNGLPPPPGPPEHQQRLILEPGMPLPPGARPVGQPEVTHITQVILPVFGY